MTLSEINLKTIPNYHTWLEEQIRQLSVEALSTNTVTCNACGEIAGTYILEYHHQTFRLSGEETYSFLNFVISRKSEP